MDNYRALIAIVLSMAVLLVYQFFFVPAPPPPLEQSGQGVGELADSNGEQRERVAPVSLSPDPAGEGAGAVPIPAATPLDPADEAGEITVETSLYTAVISESGGVLKSLRTKEFREDVGPDSPPKELVRTDFGEGRPLFFSWGVEPGRADLLSFKADQERLDLSAGEYRTLTLRAVSPLGLEYLRTYTFKDHEYLIELAVEVRNLADHPQQGAPYLTLSNRSFSGGSDPLDRFLFAGPVALVDDEVHEVKVDELAAERAGRSFTGGVSWAGYYDAYFFTGIIPLNMGQATAHFSSRGDGVAHTVLAAAVDVIPPGGVERYDFLAYFGPKKLSLLKGIGHQLERTVNFGFFDFLARPTLHLLNFLYGLVGNYGVAIILVTVLIKIAFWPLTQKGMKSMKVMQKIQPKMAKLREKYKDDRQRQQQEMLKLYQTYKVNPLGGCLPMILQIPVFFALYKVLLQSVELRHAPFILWINDLSAPDRLFIGFDLPWLGGIPVLTLLMAISMFVQQKMTPVSDPMQARIMLFLPLVFFFLFLNFASGLVLYWFINNVLTISQQYMIYRQKD